MVQNANKLWVAIIVIVKLSVTVAIYLKPQQAQCWCQTISAGLTPPSSPRHNMQLQLHTHKQILSLQITNFEVCLVWSGGIFSRVKKLKDNVFSQIE